MSAKVNSFVAECFWPDVHEQDIRRLDERILACITGGAGVRYLGSILMLEDEVVLCQFEGDAASVRAAAERAEVPFERILETSRSPRKANPNGDSS
jgi:hypothetical protein